MHYKKLEVWKESIKLVKLVYEITTIYPKDEIYGVIGQIRRSAVSIPSNIAEGIVKHSDKETLRFLDIALGSIAELDTQMIISKEIGYINNYDAVELQIDKVNALIQGTIKYYNKQIKDNNALVP